MPWSDPGINAVSRVRTRYDGTRAHRTRFVCGLYVCEDCDVAFAPIGGRRSAWRVYDGRGETICDDVPECTKERKRKKRGERRTK